MLFADLVAVSDRVASTRKRTEKISLIAACLKQLPEAELAAGAYYLAGELPQGKIGVGWANVKDTLLAAPAETPSLSIAAVDGALAELAAVKGAGSTKRRAAALSGLLSRATQDEQSFLRRLLIGELRQGALESLVLEGIAAAAGVRSAGVRRAQMLASDLGAVARAAMLEGEAGVARFDLTLFVPVQPMLAQTANSVGEALDRFSPAAFELKLDGARVQAHKRGGEVRAFSRQLNDVTARVPELVEVVAALPAEELILDGETIALGKEGAPLPFQVTMRRFGRRLDVERMREELPLSVFFFDVLRANGRTLIDAPASERIAVLESIVPEPMRVPRLVTGDHDAAAAALERALEQGHEGMMAKSLDAPYEAGNRGAGWLKLKAVHTLDLVVLAVEWGSGRRQGWLSNLHLGARDEATGELVMLGKTFKGMTDEMLAWQTKTLLELELRREGHIVWVRPELVVEVAIGDVQKSSQYPAGMALRFARVKRYRTDKKPDEADTLATVRKLHDAAWSR